MLAGASGRRPRRRPARLRGAAADPAGPTWDLGERVGEIESLSVAPEARGRASARRCSRPAASTSAPAGDRVWSVAVVEANEGAVESTSGPASAPTTASLLGRIEP